jgi:hypothetical protein
MQFLRVLSVAAMAAVFAIATLATPISAADSIPFKASFQGTFTITFGPETNELQFQGIGHATHLGKSSVQGHALLRPESPGAPCSDIVSGTDQTIITGANGDQVRISNEARDCLEMTPDGRILIHGRGTYTITGGTGRDEGATGKGTVSTEAVVTGGVPNHSATGTFNPLSFQGTISRPG